MAQIPFWVVIPAAGVGSRMQADRPKQYLLLGKRVLIEHTLDCFLGHPDLLGLVVCLSDEDTFWAHFDFAYDPRITKASGGAERADSVLNGLDRLLAKGADLDDWVLVHDAARPNLSVGDLNKLLLSLHRDPVGGLLAVPVRDTLKQADAEGRVRATPDRRHFWQAYTPQMFRLGMLRDALAGALQAGALVTDESSAMEWAGHAPRLIEGRADNIKVTRPEDLDWLASLQD